MFACTRVAGGDTNSGCEEEEDRSMRTDSLTAFAAVLLSAAFVNFIQHKFRTLKIVVTRAGAHVTQAVPAMHNHQQQTGQDARPAGWISLASYFRRIDIPEPLVAAKVLPSSCTSSFTLSFTLARVVLLHFIC